MSYAWGESASLSGEYSEQVFRKECVKLIVFNLLKPTGYVMQQQFNILSPAGYVMQQQVNLLKPTGYVMHQQFNFQQLYALRTLYLCVLYLSENKQRLVPLTA